MKILLILLILLIPTCAMASDTVLDTYYEFGRKGSSGLVDEEDLTDEFDYSKYNVKFSGKLNDSASYYAKYQYYDKDFDSLENLDNRFHYGGVGVDAPLYKNGDLLIKAGPDLEFKKKIYQDSKNLDYDQIKFDIPLTFKKEGDWTIKAAGGINSYHYSYAPRDQLKLNVSLDVSKKLFDEKLELSAFYKYQYIMRQKIADRQETTYGGVMDLKIDSRFIKGLEAGVTRGKDNTIIFEEREDSFDYKYLNWHIKSKHSFPDRYKTSLKYTDMTREYADFNHNFDGFMIENPWDIRIFEKGALSLDMKLGFMHKQYRYPYVASPFAFYNDALSSSAELGMKNDWAINMGSDVRFWKYPARRTNDKIYYIEKVSLDKYFFKKDLTLGFEYKYTFKNFLHRIDITESVYRFRGIYKF